MLQKLRPASKCVALSTPPDDSFASNALLFRLKAQLDLHDKKYLCAFSGGLDSTVLLHAAAQIPGMQLRAIHIHHGLHPEADRWAEHCRCVCRDLNIQLDVVKVDVKKNAGNGTEAAARHAR